MYRLNQCVLILAVATMMSCSTTTITSKRDPQFHGSLDKVYILLGYHNLDQSFPVKLKDELIVQLATRGVQTDFQVFNQAGDEELTPWKQPAIDTIGIRRFGPAAILVITEVTSSWNQNMFAKSLTGATHDVSLFIPGQEQRVWRASVTCEGTPLISETISRGNMKGVAKKIVAQLAEDDVL
jgi:hypothetical protein